MFETFNRSKILMPLPLFQDILNSLLLFFNNLFQNFRWFFFQLKMYFVVVLLYEIWGLFSPSFGGNILSEFHIIFSNSCFQWFLVVSNFLTIHLKWDINFELFDFTLIPTTLWYFLVLGEYHSRNHSITLLSTKYWYISLLKTQNVQILNERLYDKYVCSQTFFHI